MNNVESTSTKKIKAYCEKFNIPFEFLADVLNEPKVVPMIRGKAFEFTALGMLESILPSNQWAVEKEPMNAQLGLHDRDIKVTHKESGKVLSVECKLAKNKSYRRKSKTQSQIAVKCMRSRTLGSEMVKDLAPQLGISESILTVHNDQYLPSDFDLVVTSIGNAFYRTDPAIGMYEWLPTAEGVAFLQSLDPPSKASLKDFAFKQIYVARSSDLFVSERNKVVCTRRKCDNRRNCGFIPNYLLIRFDTGNSMVISPWVHARDSLPLFESFITDVL